MFKTNTVARPLLCVLAAFALAGCPEDAPAPTDKKGAATGATAKTSGDPTTPAGAKLTDEEIDKEDIPTEQDFEQDAAKDVTPENFLDEVDKLAAEIEADK